MNYIVLDMEWNQPWPGSPSAKKVLPVAIRGEIIQIGAVRITEDQQVGDEFQVLVKSKFYRRLNRRVSKLTGIKESQLPKPSTPSKSGAATTSSSSPGASMTSPSSRRICGSTVWMKAGRNVGTMPR